MPDLIGGKTCPELTYSYLNKLFLLFGVNGPVLIQKCFNLWCYPDYF